MIDCMTKVLLYFGSFNPVHNGHTAVAGYVLERGLCDELWMVVSPRNPLKDSGGLAPDGDRLRMAEIAVGERLAGCAVRVSDVEFGLPKPSYTIDTLRYLAVKYPETAFSILTGADIMEEFDRWKDYREILDNYPIYVYPREGYTLGAFADRVTFLADAPMCDYSSTDVRRRLAEGRDVGRMVSPGVLEYINEHGLWRDGFSAALERLDASIAAWPTAALYMERGRLYHGNGQKDKALNDFLRVQELEPDNAEAQNYITMIREIFAFRYLDYYNP